MNLIDLFLNMTILDILNNMLLIASIAGPFLLIGILAIAALSAFDENVLDDMADEALAKSIIDPS